MKKVLHLPSLTLQFTTNCPVSEMKNYNFSTKAVVGSPFKVLLRKKCLYVLIRPAETKRCRQLDAGMRRQECVAIASLLRAVTPVTPIAKDAIVAPGSFIVLRLCHAACARTNHPRHASHVAGERISFYAYSTAQDNVLGAFMLHAIKRMHHAACLSCHLCLFYCIGITIN